jgi:hypothetical protein
MIIEFEVFLGQHYTLYQVDRLGYNLRDLLIHAYNDQLFDSIREALFVLILV